MNLDRSYVKFIYIVSGKDNQFVQVQCFIVYFIFKVYYFGIGIYRKCGVVIFFDDFIVNRGLVVCFDCYYWIFQGKVFYYICYIFLLVEFGRGIIGYGDVDVDGGSVIEGWGVFVSSFNYNIVVIFFFFVQIFCY